MHESSPTKYIAHLKELVKVHQVEGGVCFSYLFFKPYIFFTKINFRLARQNRPPLSDGESQASRVLEVTPHPMHFNRSVRPPPVHFSCDLYQKFLSRYITRSNHAKSQFRSSKLGEFLATEPASLYQ